jgi:hypothetical protein
MEITKAFAVDQHRGIGASLSETQISILFESMDQAKLEKFLHEFPDPALAIKELKTRVGGLEDDLAETKRIMRLSSQSIETLEKEIERLKKPPLQDQDLD